MRLRRQLAATAVALGIVLPAFACAGPSASGAMAQRIAAMKPGEWLELTANAAGTVSGTALSRVFPPQEGHPAWGYIGPRGVTDAWGGGAFDPTRDMLVVAGGGHADYGGNEVYGFSLRTLEWERLTEPSRYDPGWSTVDGTPVSRHTYDGMEYVPMLDRVAMFGGSLWRDGRPRDRHLWLFDIDRRSWTRRAAAPAAHFAATAFDPKEDRLYVRLPSRLLSYDPAQDMWRTVATEPWALGGAMAVDPERRRLVTLAGGRTWFYELGAGRPPGRQQARTTGDTDIEKHELAGLAYRPATGRIHAWPGGRTVWSLDAGDMRWRRRDPSGAAPPTERRLADGRMQAVPAGVYGKWRHVPRLDVFVAVVSADSNVWLWRPAD
jgi:hypothetical protein